MKEELNLGPTPSVLKALTYTSMKPIDALCELVDNAIDSFAGATDKVSGVNEIHIDMPTEGELAAGRGAIRVTDNGPGMTLEAAEKALTAGYSSQNAYDRLGMFGMGLNIATGKFASKTRLITAMRSDAQAVIVELDLNRLMQRQDFKVPAVRQPKADFFAESQSGTIIELTGWWPEGNPNKDFPKKLAKSGPSGVKSELGRRYATLLRGESKYDRFKIFVKGNECTPFEHCVWAKHRSVKRGSTQYPAKQIFDEVLKTQSRCLKCNLVVEDTFSDEECPKGKGGLHQVRNVAERVRGWIGVQRYDDKQDYGIDLIRNGRAIRTFEQDAFFMFTNDVGKKEKDYPIDSIFGRIVGEVHLDHVPVDFTKQDFVRSAPEWTAAIDFLRGKSSLQATQPGAKENDSPVMKIYRGYRRGRPPGLGNMLMGEWKPGDKKPGRFSRELEKEFLEKFRNREPGYYDDAKWWEKVEEASQDPGAASSFAECPECEFQNPAHAEICSNCDLLLKSKDCNSCGKKIPLSAPKCSHCGRSQVPKGPWPCGVCGFATNPPDSDECRKCKKPKGAVNVFAVDSLLANSVKDEGLSVSGVEVQLPGGENSQKFDVETRLAALRDGSLHLPAAVHIEASTRKMQIFLDKTHPVFQSLQLQPEHVVAAEAAAFIRTESLHIMSGARKGEHSLTALQEKLLDKYWKDNLSDDPELVRQDMNSLLEDVRAKMADSMADMAAEIFDSMTAHEQNAMVKSMRESNVDISEMGELKETGRFLLYIPPETVVSVFRSHPGRFFDKTVWKSPWDIPGLSEESIKAAQKQSKETHLNCLEDGAGFLRYDKPPRDIVRRARMSIEFLQREIAD